MIGYSVDWWRSQPNKAVRTIAVTLWKAEYHLHAWSTRGSTVACAWQHSHHAQQEESSEFSMPSLVVYQDMCLYCGLPQPAHAGLCSQQGQHFKRIRTHLGSLCSLDFQLILEEPSGTANFSNQGTASLHLGFSCGMARAFVQCSNAHTPTRQGN